VANKPKPQKLAALVTGAGSGIGRATAELLLGDGWSVALLDKNEASLADAKERLGEKKAIQYVTADVTDENAVERAVAEVSRIFGGLNGVVNSAGMGLNKSVFETSSSDFRKVLELNLVATFMVGRAAARIMRDRQTGGSIVNIASISGLRGSLKRSAYGASKGGVIMLTKVMANELAPLGIRVNAIAPGPVETEMVKVHHTAEDRLLYARTIPMHRYAEPIEIARAARFLLDPVQSSYITAEVLAVDGGYRGAGLIAGRD
jgi:NAD(P)-dependent dehydrogenase (short-subunit alcohol dehydrogenase family)